MHCDGCGVDRFCRSRVRAVGSVLSSTSLAASGFEVHFIDAGNGDAAIVVGQSEIIIDGGDSARVLHDYVDRYAYRGCDSTGAQPGAES